MELASFQDCGPILAKIVRYSPDIDTAMSLCRVDRYCYALANTPEIIEWLRIAFRVKYHCYDFPSLVQAVDRKTYGKRSYLHMSPARLLRKAAVAGSQAGIDLAISLKATFDWKSLQKAAANGHTMIVDKYVDGVEYGARAAALGYARSISRFPGNKEEMTKMIQKEGSTEGWDEVALNLILDDQVDILITMMKGNMVNDLETFRDACGEGKIKLAQQLAAALPDRVPSGFEYLFALDKLKEYVDTLEKTSKDRIEFIKCITALFVNAEGYNIPEVATYLRERGAQLVPAMAKVAFFREDDRLAKLVVERFFASFIKCVLEDDVARETVITINPRHAKLLADHGVTGLVKCIERIPVEQVAEHIEALRRCTNCDLDRGGLNLDEYLLEAAVKSGRVEQIDDLLDCVSGPYHRELSYAAKKGMKAMLQCLIKNMIEGEMRCGLWEMKMIIRDILDDYEDGGQTKLRDWLDIDIIKILTVEEEDEKTKMTSKR